MSSLSDLPEVIGFFSYSREDDESYKGRLSALREGIQDELSAQLGRSKTTFRLWQDREAIAPGRLWESEIKTAVEQSVFFIPIVTPRAVNSNYCKFEFEAFLARERALGRTDLVFPILYVPVPALQNEAQWRDHPVLSAIAKRQYVDWQTFRYSDVNTPAMREAVGRFCLKIVEALHHSWLSPEERRRSEEAAAKERTEDQRRQQEAETKRHAEEDAQRKKDEADAQRIAEERRQQDNEAKRHAQEEKSRRQAEAEALQRTEEERLGREAEAKQRAGAARAKPWPLMIGAAAVGIAGLAIIVATSHRETPTTPPTVAAPVDTRAAPVDTSQVATFIDRGNADIHKQDYDRAISDYSEVIRLDPTNTLAFGYRGLAYELKHDSDHAIADYNEAIRLDPTNASAYGNRGNLYDAKQDYDRAISDYSEVIRLDPKDAPAYGNRGKAYYEKQDYGRAIADFNEVIRLDPTNAPAIYHRGLAKQLKGDIAGSRADIAAAKKLDPNVDK